MVADKKETDYPLSVATGDPQSGSLLLKTLLLEDGARMETLAFRRNRYRRRFALQLD